MEQITLDRALQQVADRHGTTREEVCGGIRSFIDCCWEEQELRAAWAAVCPDGRKPTVEELIRHAADRLFREQGDAQGA